MPNLKIVKLEHLDYLTTFPDVSGAPNIEELFVHNCSKLVELHKSLGSHQKISTLHVSGCEQLKRLPSRLEMVSLMFIYLNECSSLEGFPDVSGAPNIMKLSVWDCKSLVEFHKSLGSHKRISRLYVSGCERLKRLPSRLEMESLETLSIKRCLSLERFPDMSSCMIKLSYIKLDCCCSIDGLLSSLGYLSSLKYLDLKGEKSLWTINTPMWKEYLGKRGYRESLVEDDTKALESLQKFISLDTLIESHGLRTLNLHSFSALRELNNNLIRLPAECNYEQMNHHDGWIALCAVFPPSKSRGSFRVRCYFEKDA